jgi:formylglycine-generating enzyme required for sulfatase activity
MNNDYLIPIPAGKITLRDDRIHRVWEVDIPVFSLAKFPVTQEFYFEITGENPAVFKGIRRPVENVSWYDAIRFCNLLSEKQGLIPYYDTREDEKVLVTSSNGFRLPTEAEWQYACQAGTTAATYGEIRDIAWFKENSGGKTLAVGGKAPNAFGLYDMLGNVWEWCSDLYDTEVYGVYRIFRGGGWSDEARGCLATNRRRSHPSFKIDDLGFRIARRGTSFPSGASPQSERREEPL